MTTVIRTLFAHAGVRRAGLGAILALVAASIGLGTAWRARESSPGSAEPVEVRDGAIVVDPLTDPNDALQKASDYMGFRVLGLAKLPDPDLRMSGIGVELGPNLPNALPHAEVVYTKADPKSGKRTGFVAVLQINARAEEPANSDGVPALNRARRLVLAAPGVEEIWVAELGGPRNRAVYTIFTPARSFYVTIEGVAMDDAAVVAIAAELAAQ